MSFKDKLMQQSEATRRRLALGATIVICLFIFTLWLGQTSHTVAITIGNAQKVGEETLAPNSPFTVIRNLGSALKGIFSSAQAPGTPRQDYSAATSSANEIQSSKP